MQHVDALGVRLSATQPTFRQPAKKHKKKLESRRSRNVLACAVLDGGHSSSLVHETMPER